jgi:hypothetical protein
VRYCCSELKLDEDASEALATRASELRSVIGGKRFVLDALLLELERELQGNSAEKGSAELDSRLTAMVTSVFDLCDDVASQQARVLDAVDVFLSQPQRALCVRTLYSEHCIEKECKHTEETIVEDEWTSCLSDEKRERMAGLKKELMELGITHKGRVQQLVADACAEGNHHGSAEESVV